MAANETQAQTTNATNMPHYVYGSGSYGCLYDDGPHVARTYRDAVDAIAETFGLGRIRRAVLNRQGYIDLSNRRDGADYAEITACTCAAPWQHDEHGDPAEWQTEEEE